MNANGNQIIPGIAAHVQAAALQVQGMVGALPPSCASVAPADMTAPGASYPFHYSDPTVLLSDASNVKRLLRHISELWVNNDAENGMKRSLLVLLLGARLRPAQNVLSLPLGTSLTLQAIGNLDALLANFGGAPVDFDDAAFLFGSIVEASPLATLGNGMVQPREALRLPAEETLHRLAEHVTVARLCPYGDDMCRFWEMSLVCGDVARRPDFVTRVLSAGGGLTQGRRNVSARLLTADAALAMAHGSTPAVAALDQGVELARICEVVFDKSGLCPSAVRLVRSPGSLHDFSTWRTDFIKGDSAACAKVLLRLLLQSGLENLQRVLCISRAQLGDTRNLPQLVKKLQQQVRNQTTQPMEDTQLSALNAGLGNWMHVLPLANGAAGAAVPGLAAAGPGGGPLPAAPSAQHHVNLISAAVATLNNARGACAGGGGRRGGEDAGGDGFLAGGASGSASTPAPRLLLTCLQNQNVFLQWCETMTPPSKASAMRVLAAAILTGNVVIIRALFRSFSQLNIPGLEMVRASAAYLSRYIAHTVCGLSLLGNEDIEKRTDRLEPLLTMSRLEEHMQGKRMLSLVEVAEIFSAYEQELTLVKNYTPHLSSMLRDARCTQLLNFTVTLYKLLGDDISSMLHPTHGAVVKRNALSIITGPEVATDAMEKDVSEMLTTAQRARKTWFEYNYSTGNAAPCAPHPFVASALNEDAEDATLLFKRRRCENFQARIDGGQQGAQQQGAQQQQAQQQGAQQHGAQQQWAQQQQAPGPPPPYPPPTLGHNHGATAGHGSYGGVSPTGGGGAPPLLRALSGRPVATVRGLLGARRGGNSDCTIQDGVINFAGSSYSHPSLARVWNDMYPSLPFVDDCIPAMLTTVQQEDAVLRRLPTTSSNDVVDAVLRFWSAQRGASALQQPDFWQPRRN